MRGCFYLKNSQTEQKTPCQEFNVEGFNRLISLYKLLFFLVSYRFSVQSDQEEAQKLVSTHFYTFLECKYLPAGTKLAAVCFLSKLVICVKAVVHFDLRW